MATDAILCTSADGVATITLNRPAVLNSFNGEMARALQSTLAGLADDGSVRAVLLTGAGRAFCAGQDLADAMPKGTPPIDLGDVVRTRWNPIILAIRTLEKPVVCAVNGTAAGAGANLALACDIVFAASGATFIQSFAKIGLIPDSGGTFILPRLVGLPRAAALAMLGEKLSAERALAWGMIYEVCEPEALMERATATARYLATQPTRTLGLIKRGFNRSMGVDLGAQLAYEAELQQEAAKSTDFIEGVRAFLEKRPPKFRGD
jgi:2-(1,2-epoxy-1,2-dihydrophenyl)acetyl-CoA isomerase